MEPVVPGGFARVGGCALVREWVHTDALAPILENSMEVKGRTDPGEVLSRYMNRETGGGDARVAGDLGEVELEQSPASWRRRSQRMHGSGGNVEGCAEVVVGTGLQQGGIGTGR